MQTLASLPLILKSVQPSTHLGELTELTRPGGPRAVAVLDEGVVVGIVECRCLCMFNPLMRVKDVMKTTFVNFSGDTTVLRAAQDFLSYDLEGAPVFRGREFLGVVTMSMLLRELGRSWDPLTGLSWSDRLREWGIARLREGKEITLLFIDLDDFGQYNKKYGHIVGDYVLQKFSRALMEQCDPSVDTLVRYGGDEFVIGTLRTRQEAETLAFKIKQSLSDFRIEQDNGIVRFSIGIFGGRRTGERDQVHFAATVDNLINLASKDCMSQKATRTSLRQTSADIESAV